jgi:hypothetical protein
MKLHINTNKGEYIKDLPVSWNDISASMFAELQGKQGEELFSTILDIEPEAFKSIPLETYNFLADSLCFLDYDIPEYIPAFAETLNIPFASVGQLEKANELLNLYPLWEAAPFLFAIYENKDYNEHEAFKKAIEYQKEPISKIYSTVLKIIEQINSFYQKYLPLISNEPDENEIAAGLDRFTKFGFFATLATKCEGNPLIYNEMLKVPADVFYMTLYFEHEKNEYQQELSKLQRLTTSELA